MAQHNHNQEKSCSACATDMLAEKEPLWKQKSVIIIATSSILMAAGLYFEFLTDLRLVAQILLLAVVLVAGFSIIKKGVTALFKKKFNMNLLISLAAVGAFSIGHGEEGAAVILLFYIAEFLEDYAGERAKNSIASLLKLVPEVATIKENGKETEVHTHAVKPNDIVVVKPGDKIPLDGIVIAGSSTVNQAPITGESVPVLKSSGSQVFAGTINEDGYLEIKVTKKSDETILSKIVKMVETAEQQKSKTEKFIDRFAAIYTPAVIAVAFCVMLIPPLLFGLSFSEWFYKALVLLVVSCPCALAISTPVSMVSGITSAARKGVLIKAGSYLEETRKAKVLAFDKTGTLTEGKPNVIDIIPMDESEENDVLRIAYALESKSKHPLAEAIVRLAESKNLKYDEAKGFESITGKGIKGTVNGKTYYVGNRTFFEDLKPARRQGGIVFSEEKIKGLENEGKTVILVGTQGKTLGIITLMDKIRDQSAEVIKQLKKMGIHPVMLTGDNKRIAQAIAHKLGIDDYYAELLPEDKVDIVEKLIQKHQHVIMVGDGVNDAPALAKAQVGIAMGAIGSDVAIETADIALMQDDLSRVEYLIKLSRSTMSVVKQNVLAAILIKGSFAILTFPGFVSLWLAVAVGDMGLSLGVILNSLRLAWVKK